MTRRQVELTHPDRVLFPDDGITKADLAAYHEAVAPAMLPLIAGRPVTLQRFPRGIAARSAGPRPQHGGDGFYQKQASEGFPDWIERVEVRKGRSQRVTHMVCRAPEDLVYLANLSCITPHVWLSRAAPPGGGRAGGRGRQGQGRPEGRPGPALDRPDLLVYDLDPGDDQGMVVPAARALRGLLDELGLPAFVKATGSRGLHIAVPLDGSATTGEADAFALVSAQVLAARDPERLTTEWLLADRHGRLLLDTRRNGWAQMIAAPYAVRALPGAPVSVPLAWEELDEPGWSADRHTLRTVPDRLAGAADPWAGMDAVAASLDAARDRLAELA